MLSVDEALAAVLDHAAIQPARHIAADDALGLVLAEDIKSDVDSPPFDKAMVDGYAVVSADFASGSATLHVIEEITAGMVPSRFVTPGTTTRIMTGCPVPDGADAIVMIERVDRQAQDAAHEAHPLHKQVTLADRQVAPGRNIMRRGTSLVPGQSVLSAGTVLRSIELGVLAELGRSHVRAIPRPIVAVLATGDELVASNDLPGEGQIRNSNGPMLLAAVEEAGAMPASLGMVGDDRDALVNQISRGLRADVLLLSGGVSAGVLDLVPEALASLGIVEVFHKVNFKPGKPIWFGRQETPTRPTLVFGLPGNPVSSWVCFELFVRPVLAKLSGFVAPSESRCKAALAEPLEHRGDRPTYFPSVLSNSPQGPAVRALPWHGSADLATFSRANALLVLPEGDRDFSAGETVDVRPIGPRW